MSKLFDDASLAMIPSAYKDGKLYSIRPTDGSGDFTFSRGSNLAATRVDVNGLIEKGRENLLLQSNQFDTTWATYLSSVTGNQTGYDGSSDAWLLTKSGVDGFVRQFVSVSGLYTFSVYAKAGSLNFCRVYMASSVASVAAYVDLTDGSVGTLLDSPIDVVTQSVGGGWYRISITHNDSGMNNFRIYPAQADNDASGTSGNIYIQDAQLESSMVATDYIETGTSAAQSGILEDMPRLDYSGGASCPSLLLEPQRTNVLTHSEYISGGAWTSAGSAVTANETTSPDGTTNATKILESAALGIHATNNSSPITGSATSTASVFYKKGTRRYFSIKLQIGGSSYTQVFDSEGLVTGSNYPNGLTDVVTTIENYGNGWGRFSVKGTSSTGVSSYIIVSLSDSLNPTFDSGNFNPKYTGTGTDYGYLYGAQLELGSYPTSYIPTYGTSQTRSYDVCKKTNIDSLVAEEGTAFIDVTNGDENEVNAFMTIADSSVYPNHIWIGQNGTTLSLYIKTNDTYEILQNNITSVEGRKKIAVVYTADVVKVFVNGSELYSTSNVALPSLLNRVELGAFNTSINTGTARYDQAILFPTALTDSECIALTTI